MAAKEAGIDPRADEDQYRLVLRNVGGFRSAADKTASREGFIAVMAFFEERAGGKLSRADAGYWQGQDAQFNPRDPLIWKIRQQAKQLGMTDGELDAFLASKHMSSGSYSRLADAPTRWLSKVLDGLRAIAHRKDTQPRKAATLW